MAAIPRELIESELFGHEKGAFTGAHGARRRPLRAGARAARCSSTRSATCRSRRRPGCCACCRRASTPPVGGRTPIRADVRIIAATHRDLRQLIRQGLFREDLFYRLNVVPIRLPPLRERSRGHPGAGAPFPRRRRRARGCRRRRSTRPAMERLRRYRWPGNVRELENLVRRLAALYPQEVIGVDVIEAELAEAPPPRRAGRGGRRRRARAPPSSGISTIISPRIKDGLPAAGLYDRVLREVERPLIVADPRRHPRQPDQGRPAARPQPQHAAQENPRIGHPGGARPKIATAAPRRQRWHGAAATGQAAAP